MNTLTDQTIRPRDNYKPNVENTLLQNIPKYLHTNIGVNINT